MPHAGFAHKGPVKITIVQKASPISAEAAAISSKVVQKGGGGLHPDMLTAMLVCLGIFTIIYISLLIRRLRLINIERRIKLLETD